MALAFEFWAKFFFMNVVLDKNQFNFYELKWFFIKIPQKTGFSAFKGQKGQIEEIPVSTSFFGTKPFQFIKGELIFIQNHIREKKFGPKFKGRGHVTPYN